MLKYPNIKFIQHFRRATLDAIIAAKISVQRFHIEMLDIYVYMIRDIEVIKDLQRCLRNAVPELPSSAKLCRSIRMRHVLHKWHVGNV